MGAAHVWVSQPSVNGQSIEFQYKDESSITIRALPKEDDGGHNAVFEMSGNKKMDAEDLGHLVAFLIRHYNADDEFDMRQLLYKLTPILNRYGLHWE